MKNNDTLIISAYTCCGKTYACGHYNGQLTVLDCDSSRFSKKSDKEPLPDMGNGCEWQEVMVDDPAFPGNYIDFIKENIGKADVIFVSGDLKVRQVLADAEIKYRTMYPAEDMLNEWVGRMYRRGDDDSDIRFQIRNWDRLMKSVMDEPHGIGIDRLGSNEYIDIDLLFGQ